MIVVILDEDQQYRIGQIHFIEFVIWILNVKISSERHGVTVELPIF